MNEQATGDPLLARAVVLHTGGHLDDAAKIYLEILAGSPNDFDATHLLGVVALQQGKFDTAQRLINSALTVNPFDAAAMGNLGTSYLRGGQLESALHWFEFSLKLQPDSTTARLDVATALHHLGRHRDSIAILRVVDPAEANTYPVSNLLGACLLKVGDVEDAVKQFEAATRAEPDNAEGWANLSVALNAIGQNENARICADRAVALKPSSPTALGALGAAQFDQGRVTEAIESYRLGVSAPGPSAQMLAAFGSALLANGLNDEAIEQFTRAVELDGKHLNARWASALAHLKPIFRTESEIDESRLSFARGMDEVDKWYQTSDTVDEPFSTVGAIQPFYIAYQPFNNRSLLLKYGAMCARWMKTLPAALLGEIAASGSGGANAPDAKIRVGIASAYIQDHSVWNAITRGWVYNLDPARFEVHVFKLSPSADDETAKARDAVASLEDQPHNLPAWVRAVLRKRIDVLIYPDIGMHPMTLQLASLRLAPVQAATWGHPETTGLPTIDLFISAEGLEPDNAAENYSETLVRLPNLGVHVEPLVPEIPKLRLKSLGLPASEPLLLCPGSPFKYSPLHDEVWVQIARQLRRRFLRWNSGGRLVFFRSRSDTMDRMLESRLRQRFDEAGVRFDQHVSIVPNLDRARFYGLMKRSALLLDTIGFSGFNTAMQAIECDLPVLAFEGEFMRGRLASAIMRRLELPEMVITTKEMFVHRAVELAGHPGQRNTIRAKIIARRKILFNDLAPVRALEQHLINAVERSRVALKNERTG